MAQIAAMYPAKQLTTLKHIPRTIAGQAPCSIKKIIAMKEQLAHSANQAPRHAPHCATLLRLSSALLDTATSPCIAPPWGLNCPKVVELELCPNTEVEHHFVPDKTEETLKKEIFIFFSFFLFSEKDSFFFSIFLLASVDVGRWDLHSWRSLRKHIYNVCMHRSCRTLLLGYEVHSLMLGSSFRETHVRAMGFPSLSFMATERLSSVYNAISTRGRNLLNSNGPYL